jgi:hypothetical protein
MEKSAFLKQLLMSMLESGATDSEPTKLGGTIRAALALPDILPAPAGDRFRG